MAGTRSSSKESLETVSVLCWSNIYIYTFKAFKNKQTKGVQWYKKMRLNSALLPFCLMCLEKSLQKYAHLIFFWVTNCLGNILPYRVFVQ